MSSIGIGLGLSDGQVQPVLNLTDSVNSSNTSYEALFNTPAGVAAKVVVYTTDEAVADKVITDVEATMQWTNITHEPESPPPLLFNLIMGWVAALTIVFFLAFFAFLGIIVYGVFGEVEFRLQEYWVNQIPIYAAFALPVIGIIFNIGELFCFYRNNKNKVS